MKSILNSVMRVVVCCLVDGNCVFLCRLWLNLLRLCVMVVWWCLVVGCGLFGSWVGCVVCLLMLGCLEWLLLSFWWCIDWVRWWKLFLLVCCLIMICVVVVFILKWFVGKVLVGCGLLMMVIGLWVFVGSVKGGLDCMLVFVGMFLVILCLGNIVLFIMVLYVIVMVCL